MMGIRVLSQKFEDANMATHPFWGFGSSREELDHVGRLMDAKPSRYNVNFGDFDLPLPFDPYKDDFLVWNKSMSDRRPPIQDYCDKPDAFDEHGKLRAKYRCDEYQTNLIINDPTFAFDFFQQSGKFVSEKFRDTLMLPGNSVEYVGLNDNQCPSEVRAQKYMVMRVLAFRDVIDVARADDFSDEHPYMRFPTVHEPLIFAFKDIEVDVPLFFDFRYPGTLATDAFAERALRSGLTGFKFLGHNTVGAKHTVFYKSLDGIEPYKNIP
jgi:hypothetical protein